MECNLKSAYEFLLVDFYIHRIITLKKKKKPLLQTADLHAFTQKESECSKFSFLIHTPPSFLVYTWMYTLNIRPRAVWLHRAIIFDGCMGSSMWAGLTDINTLLFGATLFSWFTYNLLGLKQVFYMYISIVCCHYLGHWRRPSGLKSVRSSGCFVKPMFWS